MALGRATKVFLSCWSINLACTCTSTSSMPIAIPINMITEQISEVANRLEEAYIVWLARGGIAA